MFHFVISPDRPTYREDQLCQSFLAFLQWTHDWMLQHALPEPSEHSLDPYALAMFRLVRQATQYFRDNASPPANLRAAMQATLGYQDTCLLRAANFSMRYMQMLEHRR